MAISTIITQSDKLEKKLILSLKDIEKEVWVLVQDLIKEFNIKGGQFVPEADGSFIIATLNRRIKELLQRVGLEDEITKYLDNFDAIDAAIKAVQNKENGIRLDQSIFNNQKLWLRDKTVNSLLESNVSTRFIQPVKDILFNRITFGGSVVDAEKQLRSIVLGKPNELGVFERWVGQVARDAVYEYQGAVNAQVKVQYELNALRYVGGLVEDSRCQCRRWVEDYGGLLTDEILPEEIKWAYRYGSGMKPDTTPENFAQKRGGYNCTHIAIATRSEVKQVVLGGTGCK